MPISEIVSSLVPNKSPFVWRKDRGDSEIKRIFGTETKKQGIFPNAFQNYKQQIAKIFPFQHSRKPLREIQTTIIPPPEEDPPYADVTPPPEREDALVDVSGNRGS
jgi:hypothetical protein